MKKDDKTEVKILTLPNGYSLDIHKGGADHGYLYFTLHQLLEGFIYHVGLEEMEAVDKERIRDIIEASLTWRDNRENVLTILQMKTEVQAMKESVSALCSKIEGQKHFLSELRKKNAALRKTIQEYEELCANNGIKRDNT